MADSRNRRLMQLKAIIEMASLINSTLDTREIRKRATEAATSLLNAEAGSLLLINHATGELFFEVAVGAKGNKLKKIKLGMGQGIAGWVAQNREPVIVHDAASDPRFYKGADKKTRFVTRNIICVPVMIKEKMLGVLEAVNKKKGRFDAKDMEILSALANHVAVAIENAQLYEEAITDGLTGLHHHRYFELRLKEEMERARRYSHPLSLLMIDIDHFKKVNDTYGHLTGDLVLKGIAMFLKNSLRLGDMVARYGGEEFAVILPHTPIKNASSVAERLRHGVERMHFDDFRITISVGVGNFESRKTDFDHEGFIRMADEALYLAKQKGRNRVESAA